MDQNPFLYTSGPRDAKIILVGEAWGSDEAYSKHPFTGHSGKELDRILFDAGLNRSQILCTNLVDLRPDANDFAAGFLHPSSRKATNLFRGIAAKEELLSGYNKLVSLIDTVKPSLVIGAGNWPLWALTSHAKVSTQKGYKLPSGIMSWRGSQTYTEAINGTVYPYLPIIHPAAILRDMSLRYITCQDLRARAARFINGKLSWAPPAHKFIYKGEYDELLNQLYRWLYRADSGEKLLICCDVETWKRKYLAVIGLADAETALAIPLFYFKDGVLQDVFSLDHETRLLILVRKLLSHKNVRITNQNYSYDFQFLYRYLAIKTTPAFDTMLAHHLLWPGTPKDLAYLASLYCDHYTYWKDESQDWDAKGSHLDMWLYNCKDTRSTYEITLELQALLAKTPGMTERYEFQLDQWELAQDMNIKGINWNTQYASTMRTELATMATALGKWLMECMPTDLQYAASGKPWYSSSQHCQYIFYDRLGIPPIKHKKTKKPTLDKESFEQIKKSTPWVGPILDKLKLLRTIQVFDRNFLSVTLGNTGRLHSAFNVGGTETFRWSSSSDAFDRGLNLQNFPKLEEE